MLAPVYAAGEKPIEGICSRALADRVRRLKPDLPVHVADNIDERSPSCGMAADLKIWFWPWEPEM